jgi:hypothetical protein
MPLGWTGASEANWEIAASVGKHTLDRGEGLFVRIYFCGYGRPGWAKFSFYPPVDVLESKPHPKSGNPDEGSIHIQVGVASWEGLAGKPSSGGLKPAEWAVSFAESIWTGRVGGSQKLTPGNFFPLAISGNPAGSRDVGDIVDDPGHRAVGEVDYIAPGDIDQKRIPPVILRATISRTAKGGDYSIPFVLTYETAGHVKSSTYRLEFRVTPFWERWLPQAMVYTASAVAIVASVFTVVWSILHP